MSAADDTLESLYLGHGRGRPWIYWLALVAGVAGLLVLPLVEIDVAVKSSGVVRWEDLAESPARGKTPGGTYIETLVAIRDLGSVYPGQRVRMQFDGFPVGTWGSPEGWVVALDENSLAETGRFKVRISPGATVLRSSTGASRPLRAGMTVAVRLLVGRCSLWQWLRQDMARLAPR